ANTLNNLGSLHAELAEYAAARRYHERALAIREANKDARVARSLYHLAEVARGEGDFAAARSSIARAIDMWTKSLGPDHPVLADALATATQIEISAGAASAAVDSARRGLALREKSAKDHPRPLAAETDLLGDALDLAGDHEGALAQHRKALALLAATVPADDLELAAPLTGLGTCLLDLGRPAEAVAPLERAVALRGAGKGGPVATARARFALARALVASGGDRG